MNDRTRRHERMTGRADKGKNLRKSIYSLWNSVKNLCVLPLPGQVPWLSSRGGEDGNVRGREPITGNFKLETDN